MHRSLAPIAVLSALLGCAPSAQAPVRQAALTLEDCRIPGVRGTTRCGTWTVAENPDKPDGRQIDLKVVVRPATDTPVASDPVFFFAGGPGQGATEVMGQVFFLDEANEHRDLVFLDMRGTGGSNKLGCEAPDPTDMLARLELDAGLDEVDACLAALDADTTQYTTPRFMDDIDAVRIALGYEQISLYGGSYGSRAGLAYIAEYGEHVRAAVLDGLAPYALKLFLDFGTDGKAALDRLFADCAADAPCAEAFPNLEARFWPWLDGLRPQDEEAPPATVTIRDPRTGFKAVDIPITRDGVASAIRGLLYQVEMASLLPLALDRAIAGDLEPLLAQALVMGDGMEESMASGLMLSVACVEDIPRITDDDRARAAAEPFLGTVLLDMFTSACSHWTVGAVPDSLFEPVQSDVPVLLLSGAEDPVTPERWAVEAGKTLPNSSVVTIPANGHIAAGAECMDEYVAAWLDAPAEPVEIDCESRHERPPFFLDFTGPTP